MDNDALIVRVSDGVYRFRMLSDQVVESSFIPEGEQFDPHSYAVVMAPQGHAQLQETADALVWTAAGIAVRIDKAPLRISYLYRGRLLTSQNKGYERDARGESVDFSLDADEALMGGGARALGMNRRGNRLPLYNKASYGYEQHAEQMNFSIPMVLSSKLYAIHFDNAAMGTLDLDSHHDNTLTYETIGGRKTWQVLAADSWPALMSAYADLTGHQPLPPRWAFGNFASRFGYHSAAEAKAVVDQFIAQKIPLDAVVFDLYWFGKDMKGTMGNLEFEHDNFPDPRGMIADFAARDIKTVLITEPFVLTTSTRWNDAVNHDVLAHGPDGQPATFDFYFGHTGLIDVFKPSARDWFWDIYKRYITLGVAGWWGDLGEPEVHPSDIVHAAGSADQVHNVYGQEWARLIAEGYHKDFPDQRPFILMRAGSSGSQRYGLIPWSGDVNRSWGGLQSQPEIALQMGMQGMGYMHSDLGGFANPNLDDELYVRWLQYGVFQPVFRPHAQEEVPSEAVLRAPAARELARTAINLRYALLPYNYTLGFDNSRTGMPLMRPLFFVEPDNAALYRSTTSFLWGDDLLVSPVMQAGQTVQQVYFPANADWFDFYTGVRHAAGSRADITLQPDRIPVFVRAGAFIPMAPPMQNTAQYTGTQLTLHYYHDRHVSNASGKVYDDDGKTPDDFQRGAYAMLQFSGHFDAQSAGAPVLRIGIDQQRGNRYANPDRQVALVVHNIAARPQAVVMQSGEKRSKADWLWDERQSTLQIAMTLHHDNPASVLITMAPMQATD